MSNLHRKFFKTRDESCVYCKAYKNGWPSCSQCAYENENSDNIICVDCPIGNLLSANGKCMICKNELGQDCETSQFVNDTNNTETLKCIKCKEDYHLNEQGHCIFIKVITNIFHIALFKFTMF